MAASLASGAAVVRARSRVCAHARACARARARAVLLLLLEPVVLLVPAVVFVRGPRCQQSTLCPPWFSLSALSSSCSSYFFCLRACPPAGRAAQGEPPRDGGQKHALTCSMCIFPLLLFKPSSQQIHLVTSRAERAPSRWREFPAKLFFPSAAGLFGRWGASAGQSARPAPRMAPMWAVGRTRGANQPVAPLK